MTPTGDLPKRIGTVAAYASTIEAQRIVDALRLEGIEAEVTDSEPSATGLGAQPTVRVVAPESRLVEAREIVRRVERGEGVPANDEGELTRLALDPSHVDAEHVDDPGEADDFVDVVAVDAMAGDATARRAWLMAWAGVLVPFLSIWVLIEVARIPREMRLTDRGHRDLGRARAVAIATLSVFVILVVATRLLGCLGTR